MKYSDSGDSLIASFGTRLKTNLQESKKKKKKKTTELNDGSRCT